jgi:hypothetical protein
LSAPEREVTSPSDFKVVGALNIDVKLVWLLNNEDIDILCVLCTFLKHI